MRNHRYSYVCALLTAFFTIFIYGCGGSSSSTSSGGSNPISVSISPTTATVASGGTTQFTATVTNDSSNAGVTWTVSSSSSTPGTVDATGKYTAPSVTKGITASVIATSKTDTTKFATATVTVNPATAAAVTISPQ